MPKRINSFLGFIFCLALFSFISCANGETEGYAAGKSEKKAEKASAAEDAEKAYVFGFPIVLMHINERVMTNNTESFDNVPLNRFRHGGFSDMKNSERVFADPDFFTSTARLALGKEPLVLELPDTGGRYAFFTVIDAWTSVTASVGTRTAGMQKQTYLITSPEWEGEVPQGMRHIKSATNMAKIEGKIRINGMEDGKKKVSAVQKKIKLAPLSRYYDENYKLPEKTYDRKIDMSDPLEQIFNMDISGYFNLLNALLADNPAYPSDKDFLESVKYLKIAPGEEFDLEIFDGRQREMLKKIPEKVKLHFEQRYGQMRACADWTVFPSGAMFPETDYEKRAFNVYAGFDIFLPEDIIRMRKFSDSDNEILDGRNKYVLHFDKESLPEAGAFWSLAAYDSRGLLCGNPANGYSLGSVKKPKANGDGSVDIYIQRPSPGKTKESNWLPAPADEFSLVLSVCRPEEKILEGRWKAPPVRKR